MISWRSVVSLDTVVSYKYPSSPRIHRFLLRLQSSPDTPDFCDNNPIVAGFTPTYTIEYYHLHSLLVRLSLRFIRTKKPSWAGLSVTYWRPVVSFDTLVSYGYTAGSPRIFRFFPRYSRYPRIFLIISFLHILWYFRILQLYLDTPVYNEYPGFLRRFRFTQILRFLQYSANIPFSSDTPILSGYSGFPQILQFKLDSPDTPVFLRYWDFF